MRPPVINLVPRLAFEVFLVCVHTEAGEKGGLGTRLITCASGQSSQQPSTILRLGLVPGHAEEKSSLGRRLLET